jgi:hypothetical protein
MEAFNIKFQQGLGNVLWDTWRNPFTAACKVDFIMYECIQDRGFQITFNTNLSYRIWVKWFMGNVDIYFMVLYKFWPKSMRRIIVYLKRSIYGLTEAKHYYVYAFQNIGIVKQIIFCGYFMFDFSVVPTDSRMF